MVKSWLEMPKSHVDIAISVYPSSEQVTTLAECPQRQQHWHQPSLFDGGSLTLCTRQINHHYQHYVVYGYYSFMAPLTLHAILFCRYDFT